MRKFLIFLTALTLCSAVKVSAQEDAQATSHFKRIEHSIYAGAGLFIERDCYYWQSYYASTPTYYVLKDKGLSYKIGYGLNYYFTEMFSLMSGVAYRREVICPFVTVDGGVPDNFGFMDIPVVFQLHSDDDYYADNKWMLGLGVVFSPCIYSGRYDYDDPTTKDPLEGKAIIKNFYVNLMPCIAYETKHFRYGVEANICLYDVNRKYEGLSTKSKYIYNVCAVLGVRF